MSLTQQAHKHILANIQPGDIAIDATLGNGHDALFLARQVGIRGMVYGFDVQQKAIDSTAHRLQAHNMESQTCLFNTGHEMMLTLIPEEHHGHVRAIMFNLGYLPGGDKSHTTLNTTTVTALQMALQLLSPSGIISILAYTGHPGGYDEYVAVRDFIIHLPDDLYSCLQIPEKTIHNSPVLLVLQKHDLKTNIQS